MITIYNETKHPWVLESRDTSTVSYLVRSRRVKIKNVFQTRSMAVLSYKNVFDSLDECAETLSESVNMKQPYLLCANQTAINFNKKELNPVINRLGHPKAILLGSVLLNRKRIINVETNNAFLLKVLTVGDELSFVASFNKKESHITFYLYTEKTKDVTVLTFTPNNESFTKTVKVVKLEDVSFVYNPSYKIKVFRPRRATSLILSHPIAIEAVKEHFGEDHTYQDVTSKTFDDVVKSLKENKYHAVTYAVNKTRREETVADKKRVQHILDKLSSCFTLVYKAYSDGQIEKVKI